jgi:hypothetical protein
LGQGNVNRHSPDERPIRPPSSSVVQEIGWEV